MRRLFCILSIVVLSVFVMPSAGHAQVSITLDSCAPGLEKWDYTAKVVKCVETSVKAAVVQLMTQLSDFMTPIVAAMLTFSVAVYGMRMFTGQFEGVASTGAYVLRVWLIGIFYYNLGGFSQAIFDIEDWLVNLVVGTSPWTVIDGLLGKIVGAGPSMTDGVDATKGLLGILGAAAVSPAATSIVFFVGISALINFLLFIFRLVMTYLTAIVMIGFMIAISPLIIPMAMFKQQTEKYFNKWIDITASAMLVPVLLFAFLSLFVNVFGFLIGNIVTTVCPSCASSMDSADYSSYLKANDPQFSWLIPWDYNTMKELRNAAPGSPLPKPAVQTNVTPTLGNAQNVNILAWPKLDFGENHPLVVQKLVFSFLGLFLFASFMKAVLDKIPYLAYNITEAVGHVSMEQSNLEANAERAMRGVQTILTGRKL